MPVVILTDSGSDIPQSLRESLGIELVPLKVIFGSESYEDTVNIHTEAFYEKLESFDGTPTTSQATPLEFAEKYKEIADKYGPDVQIVAVLLSSQLSGTYQSAVIGKSMLEQDLDVTVYDSKTASFVYGLMVVEAARAAKAGQSKEQILELLDRIRQNSRVYFMVETLTYLHKGGRIGKASALVGTLLNIKPILTIDDSGSVAPFDKVRGTKKAIARIMEELKAYAKDEPVKVVIMHGNIPEDAERYMEQCRQEFNIAEEFVMPLGPTIGTHTGPGTLAFVICKV